MDNIAGEMEIFVLVAQSRSFSATGRLTKMSASAVSKLITRLEERLKTRLVVRTTRSLQLTPEGEMYLDRAKRILEDIKTAEDEITTGGKKDPRGRLRVSASVAFGVRFIVPLIPDFLERYPNVQIDLLLTDGIIDIVGERADVAIRSGDLRDTSLKARKLMDSERIVVASPDYLARFGMPSHPRDLEGHNCLGFNFRDTWEEWPFREVGGGQAFSIPIRGNFEGNNGPTVRSLCLAGLGLARVGAFHVQPDIDSGRLVSVLADFNAGDTEHIHAVYSGHAHLAGRIRAFIDFLVEKLGSSGVMSG